MNFSSRNIRWVVSCEHGGYKIPHEYLPLFEGNKEVLQSHRGQDIGVKDVFNQFKEIADFWIINQQSRLLIEFNRSLHHSKLFSEFSDHLSPKEKNHLIDHYYTPYRRRLERTISEFIEQGNIVIHLSLHSFTPILNGETRNTDVGLLYDSRKPLEKCFCTEWKKSIHRQLPRCKVRLNYPYLGKADGLTTYMRKKVASEQYLGIEVELNQQLKSEFKHISQKMVEALRTIAL